MGTGDQYRGRQLTVVIADGNSVFRSGVVALLERESDMRAIPATSTEMLIAHVGDLTPAIVLVDVDLPPRGGIDAIARVKLRAPGSSGGRDRDSPGPSARARGGAGRGAGHHRAQRALGEPRADRAARGDRRGDAPASPARARAGRARVDRAPSRRERGAQTRSRRASARCSRSSERAGAIARSRRSSRSRS